MGTQFDIDDACAPHPVALLELARLRAENEAQAKRIAELEDWLRHHGEHNAQCGNRVVHPPYTFDAPRDPCDCGLDAALAGKGE